MHIITTLPQALADLPLLLSTPSITPHDSSSNLGSQNYGPRPLAIAVGGGFNDQAFNEMREVCKDVSQGTVWVRPDISKPLNMPDISDTDAFGKEVGRRVKVKLNEVGVGEGKEGVWFTT
jgi:hypothetical protein